MTNRICFVYPISSGKAGDARREVDDIAARVIYDTPLEEEAATP